MQAAIPEELGLFEPRDHPKHALLLWVGEFGLKAHQVVTGPMDIFCPQLDDGSRLDPGPWIFEAYRLQRPELHRLATTFGQDFNRHTGLKIGRLLKFLRLD